MSDKQKLSRLMGIKETAHLLGVNPITLRRWDDEGKLKAVRIGSRAHPKRKKRNVVGDRRYRSEDIQRFIYEGLNK